MPLHALAANRVASGRRCWLAGLVFAGVAAGPVVHAAAPEADAVEALRNSMPDTRGTGRFPALKEVDPDFDAIENVPMRGFRWAGPR